MRLRLYDNTDPADTADPADPAEPIAPTTTVMMMTMQFKYKQLHAVVETAICDAVCTTTPRMNTRYPSTKGVGLPHDNGCNQHGVVSLVRYQLSAYHLQFPDLASCHELSHHHCHELYHCHCHAWFAACCCHDSPRRGCLPPFPICVLPPLLVPPP